MTLINAKGLEHKALNERIRLAEESCTITECCGQRFIGAGMSGISIDITGVPGNALGAYLNGASIKVHANAQDAVGDTMNAGRIIIKGNVGDAAGYAMRGGCIYVRGNAGYRTGIHMKEYKEKKPVIIIGGCTGSFLGEYQAGGLIVVLGLNTDGRRIVGNFPCTGMHGGKMFLRSDCKDIAFPEQVTAAKASESDLDEIKDHLTEYCDLLDLDINDILNADFTVVTPDSKNPYKQLYIAN